jgi:hypothetical protein
MTDDAPIVAFITTIRHPLNSTDYPSVQRLAHESVTSWLRQTDSRFVIIVVSNEPVPLPTDSRVHPLLVSFPPPSSRRTPRTGLEAVLRDKGTKNAIGLTRARELGAEYVMFVDADDFIAREITAFVAAHRGAAGWTVTDGWRVQLERRALRRHRGDFHLQCGSSHIVRADLLPPTSHGITASQEQLYAEQGELLERRLGSHMHLHDDLPLVPLPFSGALYRVGTSQSHSGNALGGWSRPISKRIADRFGVPATGLSPVAIARAALPSTRAVRERARLLLHGLRRR